MKKIILASVVLSFVLTITFASTAAAAGLPTTQFPQQTPPAPLTSQTNVLQFLTLILNWVFTIFVVLAILFLILAGLQFITAGGEPAKVESARQKLIWSVVGIVVALVARGLPTVIKDILGAK